MEKFESHLSKISYTKILNYFGFRLNHSTNYFNIYRKPDSELIYYLFLDENETLQVFSHEEYQLLTKTELFFDISGASTLAEAFEKVKLLEKQDAVDSNANLSRPTRINAIVNTLAGLIEADARQLPILNTAQFKRKVFTTANGEWKTPLFYYSIDQNASNRIVNYVQWKGDKREYFNNQSYCLNASAYIPENKHMYLTSDPAAWVLFAETHHAPDYFMLLAHPEAPVEFFQLLTDIAVKYKFQKIVLQPSANKIDNKFFARALSFFLTFYYPKFFFQIDYSGNEYDIKVFSHDVVEQNRELAKIFGELNFEIQSHFMKGWEGDIEIDDSLERTYIVSSEKIKTNGKVISLESISGNPKLATVIFTSLITKMKLSDRLQFLA